MFGSTTHKNPIKDQQSGGYHGDIEEGGLYPGITGTETMLRMGFIRKVFGIIAFQLVLTACMVGVFMNNDTVQDKIASMNVWMFLGVLFLPLLLLFPLYMLRKKHPHNMVMLTVWTIAQSVLVGICCSAYSPGMVIRALVLTAGVTVGIISYTFYATKNGKEFDYLGPILFGSLVLLIIWGLMSSIFGVYGGMLQQVYLLMGCFIFCCYLVYDTFNIIKRYAEDEYVWASVSLYLDIINIFLYLLRLLNPR